MSENDTLVGFFDRDGGWVTAAEVDNRFGDDLDIATQEALESLADAHMLNVRRDDDGRIVTAQLSEFSADLYRLPEDAGVDRVVAVYVDHDIPIPDELYEEYLDELGQKLDAAGGRP